MTIYRTSEYCRKIFEVCNERDESSFFGNTDEASFIEECMDSPTTTGLHRVTVGEKEASVLFFDSQHVSILNHTFMDLDKVAEALVDQNPDICENVGGPPVSTRIIPAKSAQSSDVTDTTTVSNSLLMDIVDHIFSPEAFVAGSLTFVALRRPTQQLVATRPMPKTVGRIASPGRPTGGFFGRALRIGKIHPAIIVVTSVLDAISFKSYHDEQVEFRKFCESVNYSEVGCSAFLNIL